MGRCQLVASDGGIFAFGDVGFHGSLGESPSSPVVPVAGKRSGGAPAISEDVRREQPADLIHRRVLVETRI